MIDAQYIDALRRHNAGEDAALVIRKRLGIKAPSMRPSARRRVLVRDAYTCRDCGQPAEHVHHLVERGVGGAVNDPNNAVALCAPCHRRRHRA